MSDIDQELIDLVIANKDQDDNEILGILIGEGGVSFNKARGILNKILVEQGLRMTKAERDEKAAAILEDFGVTEETTVEDVEEQVEILIAELDIKAISARAYLRAIFEAEEIEMPKTPRKTGGARTPKEPGFRGDVKIAADFTLANPVAVENDQEAFKEFMEANGGAFTKSGTDKSAKWHAAVLDLRIFGNAWKDAGNCAD